MAEAGRVGMEQDDGSIISVPIRINACICLAGFYLSEIFNRIDLKNNHKNFGCDTFKIKGVFWNENFSSKNGDATLYIYIDPQNKSIIDYNLESDKLKSINKSEKIKKGCIFPFLH